MQNDTKKPVKNRGYKTINIKKALWDRLMIAKIEENETSLAIIISKALDAYDAQRKKLHEDD